MVEPTRAPMVPVSGMPAASTRSPAWRPHRRSPWRTVMPTALLHVAVALHHVLRTAIVVPGQLAEGPHHLLGRVIAARGVDQVPLPGRVLHARQILLHVGRRIASQTSCHGEPPRLLAVLGFLALVDQVAHALPALGAQFG